MSSVIVNGEAFALAGVPLYTNLLDFVRACGFTGAKEGCAEGECGACSVMVARPAPDGSDASEWTAVNSCLMPAAAFEGQEVVTVEGLGTPDALHPVQHEIAIRGGAQCGYCTPGFVCSMAAEYYRPGRAAASDSMTDVNHHGGNGFDLHAISGNLCRCTGYRPLQDAALALGSPTADDVLAARCGRVASDPPATTLRDDRGAYVRPADLAEALEILRKEEDAVVVAGCTDWGVEANVRGRRADLIVAIDRLPELRGFSVDGRRVRIGAALTLKEIESRLGGRLQLMSQLVPQFASPLIRNAATLGGNLGTGSPIGDSPPVLLALDASVVLASAEGRRTVALADYFTGYRRSVRRADELIVEVVIPLPASATSGFAKIAKRRFDDISSVAAAFAFDIVDDVVVKARIGLGGVAATPIRARATEAALEGQMWTSDAVAGAAEVLATEGMPISDQRASGDYRRAMLGESLRKLFQEATA